MEFLKVDLNLQQNFKFIRFKNRLGIDDAQATGHLVSLWMWSFQHAQDGFFDKDLAPVIAQVAMWRGDPYVFIDALLLCGAKGQSGFLEEATDGYQLHDWEEFCGKAYEKRTKESERKRVERAKRSAAAKAAAENTTAEEYANTARTSDGHFSDILRTSDGRPADNMRTSAPEREIEIDKKTRPERSIDLSCARPPETALGAVGIGRGIICLQSGKPGGCTDTPGAQRSKLAQDTGVLSGFLDLDFEDCAVKAESTAKAPPAMTRTPSPIPLCPHQAIIELYHEILPEMPRVRCWGKTCQKYLLGRWKESYERQDLAWWRGYFESVRGMDWLMGRGPSSFIADLEWLVTSRNMTKVLNGRYTSHNSKVIPHSFGTPPRSRRNMSVEEYVADFIDGDSPEISELVECAEHDRQ